MIHFLKLHGYTLFVTILVLALGAGSMHLRHVRTRPQTVSAVPPVTAAPSPLSSAAPSAAPARVWLRPVSGGILTAYSDALRYSADMDCWQVHAGVDFAASPDEPVRAAADGRVLSVSQDPLLGLTVVVDHGDGLESRYSSLAAASCTPGSRLRAGDILGTAGDTADSETLLGCHLHFEATENGLPMRPLFD